MAIDNSDIDLVITWVDGSDPAWRAEKKKWLNAIGNEKEAEAMNEARFRNWDNLQYIFRGIEEFMPWLRKVHFVTWGHLPVWLDTENPKLHIVKHTDYIPSKYLPTFNSNTIELNMHRIPGLAEQYINFNDDVFVIKPTRSDDFFIKGFPCDMACLSPQPMQRNVMPNIEINNLKIINYYFSRSDILKNKWKWLNPFLYGQYALRTACFLQFKTIIGIFEPHIPFSHTKSTLNYLWEVEYEEFEYTSLNKFRTAGDINEWLIRAWQMLAGNFMPRSKNFGRLVSANDTDKVRKYLLGRLKYKVVCINDSVDIHDFNKTKITVNRILDELLPKKSSFEI